MSGAETSDSDDDFARSYRQARKSRREARPVKEALRDFHDGTGPVTAEEVLALTQQWYPHRGALPDGLDIARVAPRMPGREIAALLALQSQSRPCVAACGNEHSWAILSLAVEYDFSLTAHGLVKTIAQTWRQLDKKQQAAIKSHLRPIHVLDVLTKTQKVTWDHISAMFQP